MTTTDSCPVCGGEEHRPLYGGVYRRCAGCGAIYQYRDIEPVRDYYASIDDLPDYRHQRGSYLSYLRSVARVVEEPEAYALIDVGAGDPTFLDAAAEVLRPRARMAVEESEIAAEALTRAGIEVVEPRELATIPKKIVTAFQVLEHIGEPYGFLGSLGLNRGDYIVLTSPNIDAVYRRLYRRYWKSFSPSHHLVLYGRESLERLLARAGIELLGFEVCVSGCHGLAHAVRISIFRTVRNLSRARKPNLFHGRNSFLAIGRVGDQRGER